MMRLPRYLPCVATACFLLVLPVSLPVASGQPAARQPAQPQVDEQLLRTVEDFWHYAKIARYDLAVAQGQRVLEFSDRPQDVLRAFETGPGQRDNLDQWLLRWQRVDELRDISTQIIRVLNEGQFQRRSDPEHILENIRRLSRGERAYQIGIGRLRESGELAIPFMIDLLRNVDEREHHASIRRGLRDMGRTALSPLLAATEMQDGQTLIAVATALGEIGYDVSVPYLARLAQREDAPEGVRSVAAQALARMGAGDARQLDVADLYYQLGERFYYNNAAIAADPRQPVAFVWFWEDGRGLYKRNVPPEIFNEIMAMRAAEYVLKHDADYAGAISLWLAANYKREVELPEGQTDTTRAEDQPDAHYYGVSAGAQYLNEALARALRDRTAPVALRVTYSLQEIAGESNLFTGPQEPPVISAMAFPDRLVRYRAAFTIASSLPQQQFPEQGRVVPLLAEAVAQTGRPTVLILTPERDELNRLVSGLEPEYTAAGGTSAEQAVNAADRLPSVDVILISEEAGPQQIERLLDLAADNPRLDQAPRVIVTRTAASPWQSWAVENPMLHTTQAREPQVLQGVLNDARRAGAVLPMDQQLATEVALEAANLLEWLAISRGQVLDVSVAEPVLLGALEDERPEIVMAVGNVLALIDSARAQSALLGKASDAEVDRDVRISLYNSVATSAKFYGNNLSDSEVETLRRAVAQETDLSVRSAAAEAHGALNLPVDQSRQLILEQSRT
jgi:hypothetical protein